MLKKIITLLLNTCLIASCASISAPNAKELQALEQPSPAISAKIAKYYPAALAWYQQSSAALAPKGRPLAKDEFAIATKLGVKHPERVRVVVLAQFPLPTDAQLRHEAERYGMGSPLESGRTMGKAILLKPKYADDKTLLAHELVHIQQIERMGSAAFIKRYLLEMEVLGYTRAPLELEAYSKQAP